MKKPSPSQFNILVIEDDDGLRDVICDVIQQEGFCCFSTGCADRALQLLQKNNIHFILSDIQMPKKSGLDLLQDIQEHLKDPPPILLMTGHANIDLENLNRLEVLDVIFKPEDLPKLTQYIHQVFQQTELWFH